MSPTQRTLAKLKSEGWTCGIVEKFNPHVRIRQDLFGVIDIVIMKPVIAERAGIVGVQACAGASHASRRAKAIAEPRLRTWLESGGRFAVMSWRKGGARGKRKTWSHRWDEVYLSELEAQCPT